ncbi:MAG: efflux RND transporter periplasmic adaptor subunit [Psychromonas sp.]
MPAINKYYSIPLLLLISLISGCNSDSTEVVLEQQKAIATVNAQALEQVEHYSEQREYVGLVRAGQQSNLGFELSGKIDNLFVDVGDTVKEGDPLIALDTQLLETSAQQLIAQQAEVAAQLSLVNANLKRQQALKQKGFSADTEIDSLNSQRNVLQANDSQLKAGLDENRLKQQKSTIYAPYSGVISERFISKGDVLNVSTPTFTLLANNGREAHIGIPAKQLKRIKKIVADQEDKQQWQLRIGEQLVTASLLNPGAQVDLKSRTVKLRFALPDNMDVINGELAYLKIEEKHHQSGYWVPLSAMTDGLRGTWNIYVLNTESPNQNIVERRTVQVLFANGQQAYVTGAITNGEQLVSNGLHRLVPGQQVAVAGSTELDIVNTDIEAP